MVDAGSLPLREQIDERVAADLQDETAVQQGGRVRGVVDQVYPFVGGVRAEAAVGDAVAPGLDFLAQGLGAAGTTDEPG